MRVFHELVFDDAIDGTTAVYTAPKWNSLLAEADSLQFAAFITQVSGTNPTITVASEISPDDKTFLQRFASPEVAAEALDTAASTVVGGKDSGTSFNSGFLRLRIQLGGTGTPKAYVKLWATGRCEFGPLDPERAPMASQDQAVATNAAATLTYAAAAAGTGYRHCLTGVAWSYSAAPTGGNISIQDGAGNTVFSIDIVASGPGSFVFPTPKQGQAETILTVTLAGGGGGVTGRVSALGHFVEKDIGS